MATVDEQRARPDVNRELVLTGEVMVEAAQQQLLDAGLAITLRFERGRQGMGEDRVGRHKIAIPQKMRAIMSRTARRHKTFNRAVAPGVTRQSEQWAATW